MNGKIKIFFGGFISACAFIGSIVLAILFRTNKHGTDTDVGAGIKNAGATCESAKGTTTELAGTTEQASRIEQDIERTNEQLANSINTSKQILSELKKRQSEKQN